MSFEKPATLTALESFVVQLCNETGAGKGHDTTDEAREAFARLLASREDEARRLIAAARKDAAGMVVHYVDGVESSLARAVAQYPEMTWPVETVTENGARYATEFPTFPATDMPAILQGADWDDMSWHNDVMPFMVHRETGIGVWTDWSDPTQREHNGPRFLTVALTHDPACGWQHDISGDTELFACETVEELADLIRETLDGMRAGDTAADAAMWARFRLGKATADDARRILEMERAAPKPCADTIAHLESIIREESE